MFILLMCVLVDAVVGRIHFFLRLDLDPALFHRLIDARCALILNFSLPEYPLLESSPAKFHASNN
ncbi:hypothetical protein B0T39_05985 [Chromobacterium haemolyticum]|nr:hypothetical protein B0T39_05985 [Chromobacterium haemolyticum]